MQKKTMNMFSMCLKYRMPIHFHVRFKDANAFSGKIFCGLNIEPCFLLYSCIWNSLQTVAEICRNTDICHDSGQKPPWKIYSGFMLLMVIILQNTHYRCPLAHLHGEQDMECFL